MRMVKDSEVVGRLNSGVNRPTGLEKQPICTAAWVEKVLTSWTVVGSF